MATKFNSADEFDLAEIHVNFMIQQLIQSRIDEGEDLTHQMSISLIDCAYASLYDTIDHKTSPYDYMLHSAVQYAKKKFGIEFTADELREADGWAGFALFETYVARSTLVLHPRLAVTDSEAPFANILPLPPKDQWTADLLTPEDAEVPNAYNTKDISEFRAFLNFCAISTKSKAAKELCREMKFLLPCCYDQNPAFEFHIPARFLMLDAVSAYKTFHGLNMEEPVEKKNLDIDYFDFT